MISLAGLSSLRVDGDLAAIPLPRRRPVLEALLHGDEEQDDTARVFLERLPDLAFYEDLAAALAAGGA